MKWAKYNLGASVPEAAGVYFSWGNLGGHPTGAGYDFSQVTYASTPGASITGNLSLNEDAARANLGAPWRMPTSAEFQELNNNCTSVWTTKNGVYGRLFTSNANGKTLFIPAAGYYNGSSLVYGGAQGHYWSSSYFSETQARYMYFGSSGVSPLVNENRFYGLPVRPVQDSEPNRSVDPPTPEG